MSLKRAKSIRFDDSVRTGPAMTGTRSSVGDGMHGAAVGADRWVAYVDIGIEVVIVDTQLRTAMHINWSKVIDCQLADETGEVKKLLDALGEKAGDKGQQKTAAA